MTEQPHDNPGADAGIDDGDDVEGHRRGGHADAEAAEGDDDVSGHMKPPPDLNRDR